MKFIISSFIFLLFTGNAFCQLWTGEQLQKANTAVDEYFLSDAEKEVILYINLCRLYPAAFAEKELKNYNGIPGIVDKNFAAYKASLAKELAERKPCATLKLSELLYDDAKCYANEISKNIRKPHERVNCLKRDYAECVYYGNGEGRHIAMQWLIDSGVESLGHRSMCLLPVHKKIGIKVNEHFEYPYCAVAEFTQ